VIRAGGPQLGEPCGILAVDETQNGGVLLYRADHSLAGGNPAPKPGKNPQPEGTSLLVAGSGELHSAEGFVSLVFFRNGCRRPADQLQGELVALLVVLVPVDQAVLTHDRPLGPGMVGTKFFQLQPQIKTGPLPIGPDHLVPVNFLTDLLPLGACRHRNRRVGMGVVEVPVRDKAVQRRVDRGRPGVEVEGAVGIGRHH